MKKILTLIGFIALMQGQFAWASATTVGESSTTPCTAINSSTAAAETTIKTESGAGGDGASR